MHPRIIQKKIFYEKHTLQFGFLMENKRRRPDFLTKS